ncbi:MAG: C69 family dipeptidase [Acidobacteria bacterium]|nr:C69 family dipeptidase [Acidobacteriota bacterium]
MRPRKVLLTLFVLLIVGLIGLAEAPQQAPQQAELQQPQQLAQQPLPTFGSPKKLCGWPPPPGVSETEWENACYACTSIPTTKEATADGSTMTSHSCDGHYEFRIHVVAGKKSAPGAMRPILKGGGLGADRAPEVKVGEIPEVAQTYTRYDASYPFMNEKQVIIGETTIGGRRELFNDEGIFDIMELERLGLERGATAREVIKIMGEFATKYGYGDSGECLTVGDPNEVWMFEIFGAGPGEKGAVWAAKRIPDGHVGVSANRPRIDKLDLKNPDYNMASESVYRVAKEMGWWKEGEEFIFNKAYSGPPGFGSTRREWRVLSTLAPSLKLDPWDLDVPFSVKPDKKVTPRDLMKLHRDVYEGTDFDMTKGLVAGPFGNPNRWRASVRPAEGFIGNERMISVTQCSYCVVLQARGWLPSWIGGLAWFAADDPKTSCFLPLYAGNTKVPEAFEIGSRTQFDRRSAWWAFNFTGNWANLNYNAMAGEIRKVATEIEDRFFAQQPIIEKTAVELYKLNPDAGRAYISDYSNRSAQDVVDAWWKLADTLVVSYQDFGLNLPGTAGAAVAYPKDWLDAVGFGKAKIQQPAAKPPIK